MYRSASGRSTGLDLNLYLLVAVGSVTCATSAPEYGWPAPRPLAADLPTFRPPRVGGLAGTAPVTFEEPETVDLATAVRLAVRHNPELQRAAWGVRLGEAAEHQARLYPNPELEFALEDFARGGGPARSMSPRQPSGSASGSRSGATDPAG